MLGGKVSKIFRRNSAKRNKDKAQPRTLRQRSSLGTIQEAQGEYGSISDYPRDVEGARPVPPPSRFHGSHEGFVHPDDEYADHDHSTRLYEGFTPSENGLGRGVTTVPSVVRHDGEYEEYPEGMYHHGSYVGDGHAGTFADEMGYTPTHGEHVEPVPIARSGSSHTGSEHGLGTIRTQTAKSMGVSRGVSRSASSAAGYGRTRPGRSHRRQVSDPIHRPRAAPIDDYYSPRLPYMIFCDFGNGLEIGNEEDGFMPYQQYLETAHFRRDHKHTYYIIPGNTPVVFHDEDNNEMFRVDAQKYNTPTLRRRKYIIQDETGKELFRIGNFGKRESQGGLLGNLGGSHSSHKGPKVIYLSDSDTSSGSVASPSPRYHASSNISNKRAAVRPAYQVTRSPVARPEFGQDVLTESSGSSVPDILITDESGERIIDPSPLPIHKSPLLPSPRSRYANELVERDHEGYFVDYESRSMFADIHEVPDTRGTNLNVYRVNASDIGGSEASYNSGSRRRSRVIRM